MPFPLSVPKIRDFDGSFALNQIAGSSAASPIDLTGCVSATKSISEACNTECKLKINNIFNINFILLEIIPDT